MPDLVMTITKSDSNERMQCIDEKHFSCQDSQDSRSFSVWRIWKRDAGQYICTYNVIQTISQFYRMSFLRKNMSYKMFENHCCRNSIVARLWRHLFVRVVLSRVKFMFSCPVIFLSQQTQLWLLYWQSRVFVLLNMSGLSGARLEVLTQGALTPRPNQMAIDGIATQILDSNTNFEWF